MRAGRREALRGLAAAALLSSAPAFANTQADLTEPMEGFTAGAEKRAAFLEKQKKYKKAWRKELSNLEFASNDAEFTESVAALTKLIRENGFQIPEGVRKQDLDQVYVTVKPRLQKDARLEYAKLEKIVREIVTVKKMDSTDPFEFN
jgi:hypothetical protein